MAQHGGDLIADVLARHGVTHLFTLCGGHISPILTGCEARGIRVVDVRDEGNAVFAADAVARMTGTCGVAAVTAGPGVTNTVTAIKNAQMAQTPLLLFGGATATLLKGRGALQDIDQMTMMKPLVKWATTVKTVPALVPTVERALADRDRGRAGAGVRRGPGRRAVSRGDRAHAGTRRKPASARPRASAPRRSSSTSRVTCTGSSTRRRYRPSIYRSGCRSSAATTRSRRPRRRCAARTSR